MDDCRNLQPAGLAPLLSAAAVLLAGGAVIPFTTPGALTDHMIQHIAIMNVAAPVIAASQLLPRMLPSGGGWTFILALLQVALIWTWHTPATLVALSGHFAAHAAILLALALTAILFWSRLMEEERTRPWVTIGALLLTGKLVCLAGALMIFAPTDLYRLPQLSISICATGGSSLSDQQLAGLLMVTACPLSYLVAAVVVAVRMLARVEKNARLRYGTENAIA